MAALVLTSAVGTLGLSGFSLFAANLAAAAVGSFIDNRLFGIGNQTIQQEGPRLTEISLSTSSQGQSIKRLFGRSRIGGNLIWATNFTETETTTSETQGGKGGGGSVTTTTTAYTYSISFAIAFCEGSDLTSLGRIWFDGRQVDISQYRYEFHKGSDDQAVDTTILNVEGAENAPAYRGIAYIVFEDLPLGDYGNRIPQVTAEITRPIIHDEDDAVENLIQGVNIIPATGDFIYSTTITTRDDGFGNAVGVNVYQSAGVADFEDSMNSLQNDFPVVTKGNLAVSWFGNDLRIGSIEIKPKVEDNTDTFLPTNWRCQGLSRASVEEINTDADGNSFYGSTPSDDSVLEGLVEMGNRGIDAYFYPFLLMDIPTGNALPDPYGGAEQAVFPWRGRITLGDPADDGTAQAQTDMNSFFGSVSASDFSVSGTQITYTGSATDWGYRRFILHYAHLCAAAANAMDSSTNFAGFYIGSEMRGLTQTRTSGTGNYPAVTAFKTLAADVRGIFDAAGLAHVEISYAADWSEYHSHRPSDGSGDVFFNLDPLWMDSNIDYVAIDNYMPISDLEISYDSSTGDSVYDVAYLQTQIEGGEGYDYFYASDTDRTNRVTTPITDGAYGKPWVFRQKDIRSWLTSSHYNRPGGTEVGSPTAWTPNAKRIVFSEFGCPAVDLGTNQPNVFYDPKSSESFFPYFSSGSRDDQILRSYYQAVITYWRDHASPIVDVSEMFAWSWDARPYPAFPARSDIWSDTSNYRLGHWLNGRSGSGPLSELIKLICEWAGLDVSTDIDVTDITGSGQIVRGYVIDQIMSAREALTSLFSAYFFDAHESGGRIVFKLRERTTFTDLDTDRFVTTSNSPAGYSITRAQETELPQAARVSYISELADYTVASIGTVRPNGSSQSVAELRFPMAFDDNYARYVSELVIQESWNARETLELNLPPSQFSLDPGDGISFTVENRDFDFRITSVDIGSTIECSAETIDTSIYDKVIDTESAYIINQPTVYGQSQIVFLDLPLFTGQETSPWATRVATYQYPYPPAVNVYLDNGSDLILQVQQIQRTQMGVTVADFPIGPHTFIDEGNTLQVDWFDHTYEFPGITESAVYDGGNIMAIQTSTGAWEVFRFINATKQFTGGDYERRWNFTRLIRGDYGTYTDMEDVIPAGAAVVLLNSNTLSALPMSEENKLNSIDYRYGPSSYNTGSPYYQDVTHSGSAVGQLPYAVAQINFALNSGNVDISWIRQTRFGGSSFEAQTVPLNEETESYEIDVFDSTNTYVETIEITGSPNYTYTGGLTEFSIVIYQMSATIGRGRPSFASYP